MGFHAYWLRSTKLIAFNSLNWNVLWDAICFSDVFCGEWQNVCLTAPHRQYPGTMVLGAVYVGMSPLALVWSLRFYNMLLDNTLRLWQMPGCIHLIKVQPVYKFLGYLEILNWLARYPPYSCLYEITAAEHFSHCHIIKEFDPNCLVCVNRPEVTYLKTKHSLS